MRTIDEARDAAATMIATLLGFWSTQQINPSSGSAVLSVALGVMLGRAQRDADLVQRGVGAVVLPAAASGAAGVVVLAASSPAVGAVAFVTVVAGAIWLRRFGRRHAAAGTLATLPFVAALVAPVPAIGWSALVAAIVYSWTSVVAWVVDPNRFAHGAEPTQPHSPRASARMAAQMAVALAAAFTVGFLTFGPHWVWPVLTAFIVCSGHRGRVDALVKGVSRLAGAALGTVLAAGLAPLVSPGDTRTLVTIFVLLAVATWLRSISYVYWAAGITAALALLYGFTGHGGAELLLVRLAGILTGGLLAIAACWLVLPVRSSDVLRRRIIDVLAALSDLLASIRTEAARLPERHDRFTAAVGRLDLPVAPRQRAVADAVRRCVAPVDVIVMSAQTTTSPQVRRLAGAVAADVGVLRRALAGRVEPSFGELPEASGTSAIEVGLRDLDALIRCAGTSPGSRPAPTTMACGAPGRPSRCRARRTSGRGSP